LLDFAPRKVDLSETLVQGEPFLPRHVHVRCSQPIEELSAHCDPALASVLVRRLSGEQNAFELEIFPSEKLPLGDFHFPVSVEAQLRNGSTPIAVELPVLGSVVHDVRVTPGSLFVGPVPTGETIERALVIASRTGGRLVVQDASCDCENVEMRRVAHSPPSSYEYVVSLTVKRPGPGATELRFSVIVNEDVEPSQIAVPMTWHGIASAPN
jgi:hypothetical protein